MNEYIHATYVGFLIFISLMLTNIYELLEGAL